jgi:DNA-binding response OmpR family regulator
MNERQKRILVVDDEAFIRVLLIQTLEYLQDQGVVLSAAKDGEEGLQIAMETAPDLIFLDVMMPALSGYEVCRRVKAVHPETTVIFLTAKGRNVDREDGIAAGADEYVTKPFDPDYVLARSAEILDIDVTLPTY